MDRLEKLHDMVTQIHIMCVKNTVTLEQNTKDIALHIKRTHLLEKQMETALIPIKFARWAVAFAVGAGAVFGFVKLVIGL